MKSTNKSSPCIRTGFLSSVLMIEGVGSVSSISVESKENAKTERQAMMARIGTARKYALVEGILID